MNEETLISLSKIRKLIIQQEQLKRFMKVQKVCKKYQLDKRTIMEAAKMCGSLYKIHTITLIEINTFDLYFSNSSRLWISEEKGAHI